MVQKGIGKEIELSRSENFFLWEGLFPGKSYYIKVRAKNQVGESEFSDWNDHDQSFTLSASAETPSNPIAISGTWNSVSLEARLPYSNGSQITDLEIEQREVDPFEIHRWTKCVKYNYKIPDDIRMIEYIDAAEQQNKLEEMVRDLEIEKQKAGFNPYGKEQAALSKKIDEIILNSRPPGKFTAYKYADLWSICCLFVLLSIHLFIFHMLIIRIKSWFYSRSLNSK